MSEPASPDPRQVAADLLRRSEALALDEVEVVVTHRRQIEVAIEKNEIHMTRTQEEPAVGVRVIHDRSLGFASTNSFRVDALGETLEGAAALARACPADPDNGLPDPAPLPEVVALYDDGIAGLTAEAALTRAHRMLRAALDHDPRVRVDAGSFQIDVVERAVRSTRGVMTFERETLVAANLMALAVDGDTVSGFDHWGDCARRLDDIDVEGLGREVAQRVIANLAARPGKSFSGVAVFTPRVVRQLLVDPLLHACSADNVQRGLSRLAKCLDRKVAAAGMSLTDDGTVAGAIGSSAFDREGMPRQGRPILSDGRLSGFLHNAYTARKGKTRTTGHAAGGARSLPGVGATNVVVAGGSESLDALIATIKRGVLVTRFSGHPRLTTGEFSGAIKGGFMIEDGHVTHPIRETMISGNAFDLLPRVVASSRDTERYYTLTSPTVLVEGVSVSARS